MKSEASNRTRAVVSSVVLVLTRSLATAAGFGVLVILGAKFGLGSEADAYFIARLIPVGLLSPLGIAFNLAFVPVYMRAFGEAGPAEAERLASGFLNGTLLVSGLLTVLYVAFADSIVFAIAPGLSPVTHEHAVLMTRILAPAIVLTGAHSVFDSVLNAQRRFIASALSALFVPAGALLGVVVLADWWGVTGVAIGAVAGFVAQLLAIVPIVRRYFAGHRWSIPKAGFMTSRTSRYLGMTILVMAGWQINILVDRLFASLLSEGSVSALSLGAILIGIIPIVVAAPVYKVLYPELVQRVHEKRNADIRNLLRDNFVIVVFLLFPVVGTVLVFVPTVTELSFSFGRFDHVAVDQTVNVIFYGALGLPASVSGMLLVYYFLVTRNGRVLTKVFFASIAANAVLAWILSNLMGVGGIALGGAVMGLIRTGALAVAAGRSLDGSVVTGLMPSLAKSILGSAVAVLGMYAVANLTAEAMAGSSIPVRLAVAGFIASIGVVGYVIVNLVLRNEPMVRLVETLRSRKQVGGQAQLG